MIGRDTVLAVVAARGGSKGLPGKNVADLGGRPLIAWTVAAARRSRRLDRTIVSSDDPRIIAAAREAGAEIPFKRPKRLATDKASIYDALFHAIDFLDEAYHYVVLLQATSPLRTASDIDACIGLCHETGAPVVSVSRAVKAPQWMYTLDAKGRLRPMLENRGGADRRQELPPAYLPNGAVYVAGIAWLRTHRSFVGPETRAYVMPPERSVDIDTHLDLLLARAIVAETPKKGRRIR